MIDSKSSNIQQQNLTRIIQGYLIFITFIMGLAATSSIQADAVFIEVKEISNTVMTNGIRKDQKLSWRLPHSFYSGTEGWSPAEAEAPVSITAAYKTANDYLKANVKGAKHLKFKSLALENAQDNQDRKIWFYVARYENPNKLSGLFKLQKAVNKDLYVSMSGICMEPEVVKK